MVRIYEIWISGEKKLDVPDLDLQEAEQKYLTVHAEEFAKTMLNKGYAVGVYYRGNEAVKGGKET